MTNGRRRPGGNRQKPRRGKRPPGLMPRLAAAHLIQAVRGYRQPLETALDDGRTGFPRLAADEKALARAIASTALRHSGEIEHVLDAHLSGPIMQKAPFLHAVWQAAIAQILFMEVPDYAAVSLAVESAAHDHKAKHFKSVVNGVLRNVLREREAFEPDPTKNAPSWLKDQLLADYGDKKMKAIMAAQTAEAALDITVADDQANWSETLGGIAIGSQTVRIKKGKAVYSLPGYKDGAWWVQDTAAAVPAQLLMSALSKKGDPASLNVLDACAAPGGKTAQLAKAGYTVTSLDISADRVRRLEENIERLRLSVKAVTEDFLTYERPELFDGILLDAPCSATGTVRRHPDVLWLKRPEQVSELITLQRSMLAKAATLLKPGGILVFCTCSLLKEEGEDHIPYAIEELGLLQLPVSSGEVAVAPELTLHDGHFRSTPDMVPVSDASLDVAQGGMDGFFTLRLMRS